MNVTLRSPSPVLTLDLDLICYYAQMSESDPRRSPVTLSSRDGIRILEAAYGLVRNGPAVDQELKEENDRLKGELLDAEASIAELNNKLDKIRKVAGEA